MKKIQYIGILAIILLFSCSKEQPMDPISSTEITQPQMIGGDKVVIEKVDDSGTVKTDDITDPEKEDKDKTNKKAKN